jgi:phospholipid/cholesterol/gamma-HCH transport system substrate-binding protein
MEIRAHYTLIGGFVLAFAFGMFGFVYWLQNTSGLGRQAIYQIRFEQPVSGLTVGSGVLFNGIRVGTITDLKLDPQDPKRLTVSIAVDPATPIHTDTQVDVTYQGLTGAPAIALKGGSASAPPLATQDDHPGVLIAGAGVGQNLSESARGTLQHIDELIAENSKPLHTAIEGISTFADMLGQNSKRVEGILGGLEKLTGVSKEAKPTVFDLVAAKDFPGIDKTIKEQMVVPDPATIIAFDTQKILIRTNEGTYSDVQGGQWADNLPKLMQARIVQSFENAKQLSAVSRPIDQLEAAYRLELGIRNFQIVPEPTPTARVEFSARLLDDKGKVIGARLFDASAAAKSVQAADAVAALNEAFGKTAHELVVWTVGLL